MNEDLISFFKNLKWPLLIGFLLVMLVYRNSYVSLLRHEIETLQQEEYKLKQELTDLRLQKRNLESEELFAVPDATIELPEVE